MIMLNLLSVGQIAFLIIVPTVVLLAISLTVYFIIRHKRMKNDFKMFYYKRIYKLAMDKDYYLINNFLFKIDDSHVGRIDHILFAEKYIYIMNDFYFDGDITGKENDKSIILIDKMGKKSYYDHPITLNKLMVSRLAMVTGMNPSLFIGICVINDNCQCGVTTSSKNFYIIQSNNLRALIKAIESRDIAKINQKQLASAVKAIDKLHRRKRRGDKK